MLARKKSEKPRINLDPDFGSVNPVRTFNVRHQESWPLNILYNVKESVAADYDEFDKQQNSFFDYTLPKPNDARLLGPECGLPPTREFEVMKLITTVPTLNFAALNLNEKEPPVCVKQEILVDPTLNAKEIDVIELSDDDEDDEIIVVGEVKKTEEVGTAGSTLQQRQHAKRVDKLAVFLKDKGIEETILEVEKEKRKDYRTTGFMNDLENTYLKVSTQENRMKTEFVLRPSDPEYIAHLVDQPKKKVKEKKQCKKEETKGRMRSPSPILVDFSSDDDAPLSSLIKKKTDSNNKKLSPVAAPKRGKFARRTEDEAPKIALPASEFIVPKKGSKLKSANVKEFLRTKAAELEKKKLEKKKKERKEKEEELKIIGEKRKRKEDNDRVESAKFKIPRKEGVSPPIDLSEPVKKNPRMNPPEKPIKTVDILGDITAQMDAAAEAAKAANSSNMSPMARDEDFVIPRQLERPMAPPSVPQRFGVQGEDEDMDISNSSPEASPRYSREKTISPTSSDEVIEMESRERRLEDEQSPQVRTSNEAGLKDQLEDEYIDPTELGNLFEVENFGERMLAMEKAAFRLYEVDNVKKFSPAIVRPSDSFSANEPRKIPVDPVENDEGSHSDPRLPAPSPKSLAKWKSQRVELDLNGHDHPLHFARKEDEEDKTKKKKKGVKWGETATKEFDPDDDDDVRPVDVDKRNEKEECTGEKEVGGRKYRIVKKVVTEPAVPKPKSCLKSRSVSTPPAPIVDPLLLLGPSTGNRSFIRPPSTPPLDELDDDDDPFNFMNAYRMPNTANPIAPTRIIPPSLSTIGRTATPKLPDFVPPPGYGVDGKKKDEEKEKREKEEKEDRERKERKEKEDRERKERERREKEEKEKMKDTTKSSSLSPDELDGPSSSKIRDNGEKNGFMKMNQGACSSSSTSSMRNMNRTLSAMPTFGGANASVYLNRIQMRIPPVASASFERGSEIVGNRAPLADYDVDDVKYQLEMRSKIVKELNIHQTLKDGCEMEYPDDKRHPTCVDQLKEQDAYRNELTSRELDWKEYNIQPVWLQSLSCKTQFAFDLNAGLYWPVVQATDRLKDTEPDFVSMDVLRQLGNSTHFATEKKALLGIDTCLPNGMTHKERFDAFFNSDTTPEGRFKNRRMYSRVFSSQSEEDAREIHNKRIERESELLKEHEELMKKNAPDGVKIATCELITNRPAGFRDFQSMIQYYKDDDYETKEPFNKKDWYCNATDYFLPYTERAGYLCDVINHFNKRYNSLYEDLSWSASNKFDSMIALDKAAFFAAQLDLESMKKWQRVGIPEEEYHPLLQRHRERMSILESASFDLDRYAELCVLIPLEKPYFHQIVDWLSSIYTTIKPISEWKIETAIDGAFREIIMLSNEKDRAGQPKDAREVFYDAYKMINLIGGSNAKKSRSETYDMDGYENL